MSYYINITLTFFSWEKIEVGVFLIRPAEKEFFAVRVRYTKSVPIGFITGTLEMKLTESRIRQSHKRSLVVCRTTQAPHTEL